MLDFCLLSRYAKRDKLYYEYKWLWRHFLKLLNSKQRHAVTTPWVNFDETMHLLGIHGIYDKDDISKWWNEEGVEPNRTAVKINKLRFIISHLNNDFYHCSKKEMNLVMALDKTHDRNKIEKAIDTLEKKYDEDSTIPIRYLAFVTELKTRQVVAFFHHFESHTRIIRPCHTMNSKKYRVFAGDAIRFLNDMSSMEMLSINKDFCMNS